MSKDLRKLPYIAEPSPWFVSVLSLAISLARSTHLLIGGFIGGDFLSTFWLPTYYS